jgi:asparagine synthase (glutamine-hydrolysing)
MSGIAGIFHAGGPAPSPDELLALVGELRHRGPDGAGLYLDRGFGMAVAAAAARSPADAHAPAAARAPLSDESGRYWVIHDGTIFNAPELRDELRRRGRRFATEHDAELLATAYAEWGAEALHRLNGQFAFALWDHGRSELFLARDRFGAAPLYIARAAGGHTHISGIHRGAGTHTSGTHTSGAATLAFASEPRALLRVTGVPRELDPLGIIESFTLWAPAPDRSAFAGIAELPAGHHLRCGPAGIGEPRRWWELPLAGAGEERRGAAPDLAEELAALLEDAVRIRLRAGGVVGTFLSGGLDSSAVAALAARLAGQPLPAFGIGFDDPRFDETASQVLVANALGAELIRLTMSAAEVARALPTVVEHLQMPTLRTAPAPLFHLAAAARAAGCDAVLTGEGADELFAGYDIFKLDRIRRFWARRPDSELRPRLLHRLYGYLPHDLNRAGPLLHEVFRGRLTETDDQLYSHLPRFDKAARLRGLFTRDFLDRAAQEGDPVARLRARLPAEFARWSPLKRAQYLEITTFFRGYLLNAQGDRVLAGNTIEGRLPFLDHRVAGFAARLPDRLLLRGLEEKHLLRRAVAPLIPPAIARREKRPYRAPIVAALAGPDAPEYVRELTRPERLAEAGVFRPDVVARLLDKCRRNAGTVVGEGDEMALVGICSVMILHETFIARPGRAAPAEAAHIVVAPESAIFR